MRKRTLKEQEYQLIALKWKLRAQYRGLILDTICWATLAVWLGIDMMLPLMGGLAGATGGVIVLKCIAKCWKERKEYVSKVTEFNTMVERGSQ